MTRLVASSTLIRSLKRPFRLGRQSRQMSPLGILPVDQRRVLGNSVVPNDNGAFLPLDTGLEVGAVGEMVVEELEEDVGLLLLEADDVTGDWTRTPSADVANNNAKRRGCLH